MHTGLPLILKKNQSYKNVLKCVFFAVKIIFMISQESGLWNVFLDILWYREYIPKSMATAWLDIKMECFEISVWKISQSIVDLIIQNSERYKSAIIEKSETEIISPTYKMFLELFFFISQYIARTFFA